MRTVKDYQQSIFEDLNPEPKKEREQPAAQKDRAAGLLSYKRECLRCRNCSLRDSCSQVVFGDGNPNSSLIFVGEGPGAEEDRIGVPFVGAAGKLLDKILAAASIERENVYIANIVKCRPPGNRLPSQVEVETCLPHLNKQLELINPRLIVCLGALAMRTLIDKKASITRIRGRWYEKEGRRYLATFHPAALLRDPGKKKFSWEDFKQLSAAYHNLSKGGPK